MRPPAQVGRPASRASAICRAGMEKDQDHARADTATGGKGRHLERAQSRHGTCFEGHGGGVRGLHGPERRVRQLHLLGRTRLDRVGAELVLHQRARHHGVRLPLPDVQPPRGDQARRRRQQARVQQLLLVRDAVLGRGRHRAAFLRHRRADVLLRQHRALGLSEQPLRGSGPRDRDERGACGPRDARDVLPLGVPRLGGLRDGRPVSRLLRIPQEAAADAAIGALSGHRRPDLRPDRPRRRPAGGVRHGVRCRHVARPRGQPDGHRAQFPVRSGPRDDHPRSF